MTVVCALAGATALLGDCVPACKRTPEQQAKVAAWEGGGRAEVLKWFGEHQFGVTPIGRPADEVIGERSVTFANGTIRIDIHVSLPEGASKEHPAPVFIYGDHSGAKEKVPPFTKLIYEGIPTNSITARGYAYVTWNFNDVCPNAARYSQNLDDWAYGIVAYLATGDKASRDVKRTPTSWGTIGAWAWGFSRVMDWIETRPELDAKRVAVLGHSRGGKTALWAAAQDTRFAMGISNNSGCGGAKLSRATPTTSCASSRRASATWRAPPWTRGPARPPRRRPGRARTTSGRPTAAPSAWATTCCPERMGYHIREGKHKLTEYDWNKYMDFADKYMR